MALFLEFSSFGPRSWFSGRFPNGIAAHGVRR